MLDTHCRSKLPGLLASRLGLLSDFDLTPAQSERAHVVWTKCVVLQLINTVLKDVFVRHALPVAGEDPQDAVASSMFRYFPLRDLEPRRKCWSQSKAYCHQHLPGLLRPRNSSKSLVSSRVCS
jgi:hypothetical protein